LITVLMHRLYARLLGMEQRDNDSEA
jgi:hypothetical protein